MEFYQRKAITFQQLKRICEHKRTGKNPLAYPNFCKDSLHKGIIQICSKKYCPVWKRWKHDTI